MLLCITGTPRQWGEPGRMPRSGQRCFESAQLACYQEVSGIVSHTKQPGRCWP